MYPLSSIFKSIVSLPKHDAEAKFLPNSNRSLYDLKIYNIISKGC